MNELDIELPEGYRITDLGPLPEEWEVVRLGEVFNVQQGKQLSSKESKDGKIKRPFLRTSNLSWGYVSISKIDEMYFTPQEYEKLRLKSGDVLVCEGGDIGRTALYRGELDECAYQNHLHRLRPKRDNIEVEFFVFWMNHAINQRQLYTYTANRTTIPNLSGSRLKSFIFPLPPLPEQKKIAAVLSTIQEVKERTEAVISATRDLKKSMMKYLFTYGPVPLPEAENVPLKETEIGMIPEEWEVVRLGDVAEFNLGRTPKRVNESYWDDGKYPWVSIADMSDFGYIYDTKEKVSQKAYEEVFKKRLVPKETLLMSFKLTIGRTSILKTDAFHNEAIISIRPNNNQVLKEFLFYFLPTIDFSNYYDNVVKGKTLNSAKIKKLLISLPPLSTQQKIASMLSAIDEKIEAEENKKKALDDLFNTLLHDLMTAKIRVNHLDLDEIELSV